jgi:hypothetical protein
MKYNTHTDIRDPYPLDSNPSDGVNQNYDGRGGDFALNGKFKGNSIDWSRQDTNSIQVLSENHKFRFILDIDGQLYTSQNFLNDLQDAINNKNPYFNLETVAVIPLKLDELRQPNRVYTFGEKYAEVKINSNLNTGDNSVNKIVNHIDWLVSKSNQELRSVREMGDWTLNTTPFDAKNDTGMGVEFTEDVERERLQTTQETLQSNTAESSVSTSSSTSNKADNPNLNSIGLEQPDKPELFGRRETENSNVTGLVNPSLVDEPIRTGGGIFGTKRNRDR